MTDFFLDARQRAMLQEMGITVWAPLPAATGVDAALPAAPAADAERAPMPAAARAPGSEVPGMPAAPAEPRRATRAATGPAAAPAATGGAAAAGPALRLHPPHVLYPAADPAQTPAALGSGWLIVTECMDPSEPLSGDAGRLLDNMLRAMQLHKHPRVLLCALERTHGAPAEDIADPTAALAATVAAAQPAMVLLLGHVAARAALGRSEPLGRLRAEPHRLAGHPAVVTYDPAFLLRQQESKGAAWADLCAALATVRAQSPG